MSALALILVGICAATLAWSWASRAASTGNELALVVVLACLATAFNLIVPIPNIELTTTVVFCTALSLGLRPAVAVGMLAVVTTGSVSGIGIWTTWQMLGFALIAVAAVAAAPMLGPNSLLRTTRERVLAGLVVGVSVLAYDLLLTVTTVQSTGAWSATEHVAPLVLFGLPYSVLHIAGSIALTLLAGPPLLLALRRAGLRLDAQWLSNDAPSPHA